MARRGLVDLVADDLVERIISGDLEPDEPLPPEAEVAEHYDVSRVTVREALRTLMARGILTIRSGKPTVINPVTQWQPLSAIVRFHEARADRGEIAVQLVELRRVFESAASAMAAGRLTDEDLDDLSAELRTMIDADAVADVESFVAADMRFHDIILGATGNIFLPLLFAPLRDIFVERRRETSSVPEIRRHAIAEHGRILEAQRTGEADEARAAMDSHMLQTLDDLRSYVLAEHT